MSLSPNGANGPGSQAQLSVSHRIGTLFAASPNRTRRISNLPISAAEDIGQTTAHARVRVTRRYMSRRDTEDGSGGEDDDGALALGAIFTVSRESCHFRAAVSPTVKSRRPVPSVVPAQ